MGKKLIVLMGLLLVLCNYLSVLHWFYLGKLAVRRIKN
jgi:hypothetical protein